MDTQMSQRDRDRINAGIHGKYAKVANNPEGHFKYPTGKAGLKALEYNPELIQALPDSVAASYCGVGNPFSIGIINKGETVLDIGCGTGVDTFMAAMMAEPTGKAVGIDLTPEMLERAETNRKIMDLKNVTFKKTSAEKLPFEDNSFDVVISNGVINLIPDKTAALNEAIRVLKPSGRLMVSDQILVSQLKMDLKDRIDSWFH